MDGPQAFRRQVRPARPRKPRSSACNCADFAPSRLLQRRLHLIGLGPQRSEGRLEPLAVGGAQRGGLLHLPAELAERLHGLLHPGHHPPRREGPRGGGGFGRRLEPGGGGVGVGPLAEAEGGDSPANLLAVPAVVGGGLGDQAALGRVVEAVELLHLGHRQLGDESGRQVAGDDVGGDAAAEQPLAEAVLLELVAVGLDEGAEADGLGGVAAGVGGGIAGEQIVEEGLADGDVEGEQVLAGEALDLGQGGRKFAGVSAVSGMRAPFCWRGPI